MSKVKITERDVTLFRFLHNYKVASTKQIAQEVFKVYSGTTRERLYKLRVDGWIKSVCRDEDGDRSISYSLSRKGHLLLKKFYPESFHIDRYRSNSVDHDLRLIDIYKLFKTKKLVTKYWPENYLQTSKLVDKDITLSHFRDIQVDAVLKLDDKKGANLLCVVEYEASLKSVSRYARKIKQYYESPVVEVILCIPKSREIMKRIQNSEMEVSPEGDKKIYYLEFEKFISGSQKVTFHNLNQQVLEVS